MRSPAQPRGDTTFGVATHGEDRYFQIFRRLEDLCYLRHEVCETSKQYRDGACDLIRGSVFTCSATEFGEKLYNDLCRSQPTLRTWNATVVALLSSLLGSAVIKSPILPALEETCITVADTFPGWMMTDSYIVTEYVCRLQQSELYHIWCEDPQEDQKRRKATSRDSRA